MKKLVFVLVAVLAVLHQDFWWWHTYEPLVFGFIPVNLAHHVGISIASSVVAALAVKYSWPTDVDELDQSTDGGGSQ